MSTYFVRATALLLAAVAMVRLAAGADPVIDPDAYGTCTIKSIEFDKDSVGLKVTGRRVATNDKWTSGSVTVFAVGNTGKRLYSSKTDPVNEDWVTTVTKLPNDAYRVYAILNLQRKEGGQIVEEQNVVSALHDSAVNLMNNPNKHKGGGVVFFKAPTPHRQNNGKEFIGNGTFAIVSGYELVPEPSAVRMYALPVDGGKVRFADPASIISNRGEIIYDGTWSGCKLPIRSELMYNVVALLNVRPSTMGEAADDAAHFIASDWYTKK